MGKVTSLLAAALGIIAGTTGGVPDIRGGMNSPTRFSLPDADTDRRTQRNRRFRRLTTSDLEALEKAEAKRARRGVRKDENWGR